VAKKGVGSLGHETNYFGLSTKAAVIKFQKKYGIKPANGLVGPLTRKKIDSLSD
jgi:peptidoglycan hydrolase-like protein with peptidoglycan-binding domain